MEKFRERELNEVLKKFQNENRIEIEFEKGLEGTIKLQDPTINFDEEKGFININSKNASFKINVTLIYCYYKKENEIQIDLNTLLIRIKKAHE